jgi:hypothetical protein
MFGFAKVVACQYFGHQTNRIRHSRGEREEEPERRRTVGALLQQPGGGPCHAGHGTDDRPAPPCVEWPLFMHASASVCMLQEFIRVRSRCWTCTGPMGRVPDILPIMPAVGFRTLIRPPWPAPGTKDYVRPFE